MGNSFERKILYTKASLEAFKKFERFDKRGTTSGKNAGNWTATKVASIIIGLAMIDVASDYEESLKDNVPVDEREAMLLASIHVAAIEASTFVAEQIIPLIGADEGELDDILEDLSRELMGELLGEDDDDEADWDDIPSEILEQVAEKAGLSADELRERYSFRAVDISSGKKLDKSALSQMNSDNTLVETQLVDMKPHLDEIENQDDLLDDFIDGLD